MILDVRERGAGIVAHKLRDLGSRFRNPEPFFDAVEGILLDASRARWRANGYGWAPLDPDTIRRKARSKDPRVRANAARTLRATGALEAALTVKDAPGQKLVRTPDSLTFGIWTGGAKGGGTSRVADVWYGQIAQKGEGERKRIILSATPAQRRKVQAALREHLGLEG